MVTTLTETPDPHDWPRRPCATPVKPADEPTRPLTTFRVPVRATGPGAPTRSYPLCLARLRLPHLRQPHRRSSREPSHAAGHCTPAQRPGTPTIRLTTHPLQFKATFRCQSIPEPSDKSWRPSPTRHADVAQLLRQTTLLHVATTPSPNDEPSLRACASRLSDKPPRNKPAPPTGRDASQRTTRRTRPSRIARLANTSCPSSHPTGCDTPHHHAFRPYSCVPPRSTNLYWPEPSRDDMPHPFSPCPERLPNPVAYRTRRLA